ncbi:MAG TPA: PadR family transcriptional regulator [Ktedonobacterales bacterium]|nr:PadR family transcriptional regulator [Ktedonobacterales bacterium]
MTMADAEGEARDERGDARAPEALLPLTPGALHILLALAGGERHGYAIMQETTRLSDGAVRLGPGTLYRTLKALLDDGLIAESGERPDPAHDDERRRYYRLTAFGRRVAQAETARLMRLVERAQALPGWEAIRALATLLAPTEAMPLHPATKGVQ